MGFYSWECKGCSRELVEGELVRLNGCVGEAAPKVIDVLREMLGEALGAPATLKEEEDSTTNPGDK